MAGIIPSLSLAPGPQYPAANAQMGQGQAAEEVDFSYETQVALLTQLKQELLPDGSIEKCSALFGKLRSDVQQQMWQLFGIRADRFNLSLFLRSPDTLFQKIEELRLYLKSRIPSLEERTEVVTACLGGVLPRGINVLIGKYAMERFDEEFFGPQQWIDYWGATPVTFTKSLSQLRELVKQKLISGANAEKPVEQMNEVECANFLRGVAVCVPEQFEPTEQLYECLNRRIRPDDKLVAGFTCAVTYIPQYVRKGDTILAVTARTLALDLGPNPIQGEAAKLLHPDDILDTLLTSEDADRTEASCYFVMEQDVAPNTRGKEPSVLTEEMSKQLDKGWQLPEPRHCIATVFSRRAWKGLLLYGQNPWTYIYCQGKSRDGHFFVLGGFGNEGLWGYDHEIGDDDHGAGGSRKFPPKFIQ